MKKLDIAKKITSVVVGFGTGIVVKGIIETNVSVTSLPAKIAVMVTAGVMGSMASDATIKHAEQMIDEIVTKWNEKTPETETK